MTLDSAQQSSVNGNKINGGDGGDVGGTEGRDQNNWGEKYELKAMDTISQKVAKKTEVNNQDQTKYMKDYIEKIRQ